ncbi:MAG: type II toxin-antitoxin system HicA family toxin [Cyanobacteria bacterium J06623_5]
MSKLEKLVASLLRDAGEYPYSDVEKVANAFGFQDIRSKGSHHTFRHSDGRQLSTIVKKGGNRFKRIYVKKIVKQLELQEWYEQKKG